MPNIPYMDLINLMAAASLAGAEQVDQHRRNFELAEARNRAAMVETAQNQVVANSAANLLVGLSALQAARRPGSFTCTTFGNTTNCR